MIKKIFSILLFLPLQLIMGQNKELEGFKLIWKGITNTSPNCTREIFNDAAGHFIVKDYYNDGGCQMIGNYLSVDPEIEDGDFLFFYSNGQISQKGCYKHGELVGDWYIYNKAGELIKIINYDFDLNITDRPILDSSEVDVMAEFTGKDFTIETEKIIDLREYLTSEIVYPQRAYKYHIQGKVYVNFKINEDGSISDALVVRKLDKDLDKEALRIIKNMPSWTPAKKDNKPVSIRYTCPVVFNIND